MNQKFIIRICSLIMGLSGLVILFSTLFPIVAYEWEAAIKYPVLISPLVDKETATFKLDNTDYTKAGSWFKGGEEANFESNGVGYFSISIPKLGIENATVSIGGEDLARSLIQYPGTAMPGKIGNSVIFGHSILPQFYDPENYLAIFSTLNKLKERDYVYVNFDGISYKYRIEDIFEVRPKDIQILEQSTSDSYLTLVTCTPPGHPLKPKRLIVRARLVRLNQASTEIRL